ncbi:MAG: NAD(P)-binding domain-containing protein [Saprospiraceae bacterium]|nr:NAD(P)-binding domain-containing protein [Saprospiraceae bacterium]
MPRKKPLPHQPLPVHTTNADIQSPRIAIIGAGCSGLAAIKVLTENGLDNLVCFEKNDQIGGNWVYTASESHSSVCETTHIISSKWLSRFSDFPMPAEYPDYPSHRQVLAYFQQYADKFDLRKHIRFKTEVLKAEKIEQERWRLTLVDGSAEEFDYLLVANGHHSAPRHPVWRDDFTGQYFHSHSFKNNQGFEGKRVLVVGAGNSGCDCAVETSRVAERVDISVRSPQYIIPKFFLGRPTDIFAAKMIWLPRSVQDALHKISVRVQVGRYRYYGLPEPDFPPTRSHPTVNSEMLEKIRHGKVHPRPGIERVEGRTVRFTDGSSSEYDVIIAATGYLMNLPFFDKDFIDWENALSVPLYLRIFHPAHKSLFFIGLVQPQGSIWPLSEAQARLVARLLKGQWALPAHWQQLAEEEGQATERAFFKSPRHAVEVHFLPYLKKLEKLAR